MSWQTVTANGAQTCFTQITEGIQQIDPRNSTIKDLMLTSSDQQLLLTNASFDQQAAKEIAAFYRKTAQQ